MTSEPRIVGIPPQVFVTDIERALAFYRDRHGFCVEYLHGEPPF